MRIAGAQLLHKFFQYCSQIRDQGTTENILRHFLDPLTKSFSQLVLQGIYPGCLPSEADLFMVSWCRAKIIHAGVSVFVTFTTWIMWALVTRPSSVAAYSPPVWSARKLSESQQQSRPSKLSCSRPLTRQLAAACADPCACMHGLGLSLNVQSTSASYKQKHPDYIRKQRHQNYGIWHAPRTTQVLPFHFIIFLQ